MTERAAKVQGMDTPCKIADAADWALSWFVPTLRDALHQPVHWHVKLWEWAMLYHHLEECGVLRESARAVGLGCGMEPLVFALCNRVARVVATDLYSSESEWFHARFKAEELAEKSPMLFPADRLEVRNMDFEGGYSIPDSSANLIWSTSSVEHVSSPMALAGLFARIARSLKPGGIFAMTTDWRIAGPQHYAPHRIIWDEDLLEKIMRTTVLQMVAPLDLRISDRWENAPCWLRYRAGQLDRPRIAFVLEEKGVVFTSVCMLFRKSDRPHMPRIIPPAPKVVRRLVRWATASEPLVAALDA